MGGRFLCAALSLIYLVDGGKVHATKEETKWTTVPKVSDRVPLTTHTLTLATFGNPNIPGTPACPSVAGPVTDAFLAPVSRILVPTAHIDDAIEELPQLS